MRIPILALKLFGVIMFVSLFILFIGYQMGHRWGLLMGLAVAIGWIFLLWRSDEAGWLDFFQPSKRLRGQDSWGLLTKVEIASRRLHMNAPELYLVQSRSSFLLSLSLGLSREVLLISQPVLDHFTNDEIEALISAELSSLWLRRRFRYRWFQWVARSVVKAAESIDRLIPFAGRAMIFTHLALPVSKVLLKLSFWNNFEAERDEMTLSLVPERRAFASALWKLMSLSQVHPLKIPAGSEHLFLVNPSRREIEGQILRFHSPLNQRMRRILGAESV